ncbi:MAG: TetR/AcrR family transcriptional regulator [Pseudonocardia sp.]
MAVCVELIERDGADALSMRRVAAELGAAPMSLYNHVPNKAALLDAVTEHIMSGVGLEIDTDLSPDTDWCDQARELARSFRAVARRYPRSVQVVITRQPSGSVGLRPVELALGAVRRAGFDDETSVRLVRTFVSFIIGSILHEAVGHDHEGDFEFGLELLIGAMQSLRNTRRKG